MREIRELRERQVAQQAQIDALIAANAAKDAALAAAQQSAATANAQAQAATAQTQTVTATVQANTDAVQALQSNVETIQTANVGLAKTISANKVELAERIDSPSALHYKGLTITPVAFLALEGVVAAARHQLRHQHALQHHAVPGRDRCPHDGDKLLRAAEPAGWTV